MYTHPEAYTAHIHTKKYLYTHDDDDDDEKPHCFVTLNTYG